MERQLDKRALSGSWKIVEIIREGAECLNRSEVDLIADRAAWRTVGLETGL